MQENTPPLSTFSENGKEVESIAKTIIKDLDRHTITQESCRTLHKGFERALRDSYEMGPSALTRSLNAAFSKLRRATTIRMNRIDESDCVLVQLWLNSGEQLRLILQVSS